MRKRELIGFVSSQFAGAELAHDSESNIYDEELESNHRTCRSYKRRRIQKEFIETWETLRG